MSSPLPLNFVTKLNRCLRDREQTLIPRAAVELGHSPRYARDRIRRILLVTRTPTPDDLVWVFAFMQTKAFACHHQFPPDSHILRERVMNFVCTECRMPLAIPCYQEPVHAMLPKHRFRGHPPRRR